MNKPATLDDVIHRVRSFAQSKGWSLHRLSTEAGVHWESVRGLYDDPDWSANTRTLRKLEAIVPTDFTPTAPGRRAPKRAA